jgi:hypothetical protein
MGPPRQNCGRVQSLHRSIGGTTTSTPSRVNQCGVSMSSEADRTNDRSNLAVCGSRTLASEVDQLRRVAIPGGYSTLSPLGRRKLRAMSRRRRRRDHRHAPTGAQATRPTGFHLPIIAVRYPSRWKHRGNVATCGSISGARYPPRGRPASGAPAMGIARSATHGRGACRPHCQSAHRLTASLAWQARRMTASGCARKGSGRRGRRTPARLREP